MATLDDSPSLFTGQPWTIWAEKAMEKGKDSLCNESEDEIKITPESDTTKLKKEDMMLYGFCPARDDFYLVVCEHCHKVIKPQALKSHIEHRHGKFSPKRSKAEFFGDPQSPTISSPPVVVSKSSFGPTRPSFTAKPVQSSLSKHVNAKLSGSSVTSGGGSKPSVGKSKHQLLHLQLQQQQFLQLQFLQQQQQQQQQQQNNHSMPVVRVERMPTNLVKKPSPTASQPPDKLLKMEKVLASPSEKPTRPPILTPAEKKSISTMPVNTIANLGPNIIVSEKKPSNSKKPPKERKLLPCKEREFDPNKHCGVWIHEISKQCTRSLTCKTHSLSLRRAVAGRKKNFDELLIDHRAVKEAQVKAAQAAAAAANSSSHNSSGGLSCQNKTSSSSSKALFNKSLKQLNKSPSSSLNRSLSILNAAILKDQVPVSLDLHRRTTSDGEADIEEVEKMDCHHLNHHPRPAALCSFGARQMSSGLLVFDRRLDLLRAAFRTVVERHLHPPPLKKLCVESKLSAGHEPMESNDPYDFILADSQHAHNFTSKAPTASSKSVPKVKAKPINRTSKPKESTLALSNNSLTKTHNNSVKRKRNNAGSSNNATIIPSAPSPLSTSSLSWSGSNSPLPLTIPMTGSLTGVPLIATTKNHISTTLPPGLVHPKEMGLVFTALDPSCISIPNGQLSGATLTYSHSPSITTTKSKSSKNRTCNKSGSNRTSYSNSGDCQRTSLNHFSPTLSNSTLLMDNLMHHVNLHPTSNQTSPSRPSPTPSPFRSGSVSPQISLVSITNGAGPLPSPTITGLKGFPNNINPNLSISPTSRTSTPSPLSSEMSPTNAGHTIKSTKCQNASSARHTSVFQKTIAKQQLQPPQLAPSLNLGLTAKLAGSYQDIFCKEGLGNPGIFSAKSGSPRTPPPLAMSSMPVRFPLPNMAIPLQLPISKQRTLYTSNREKQRRREVRMQTSPSNAIS